MKRKECLAKAGLLQGIYDNREVMVRLAEKNSQKRGATNVGCFVIKGKDGEKILTDQNSFPFETDEVLDLIGLEEIVEKWKNKTAENHFFELTFTPWNDASRRAIWIARAFDETIATIVVIKKSKIPILFGLSVRKISEKAYRERREIAENVEKFF